MDNQQIYIKLVNEARLGSEKSLEELAKVGSERLRVYLRRLTQDRELAEDIIQESMLEMIKFIGQLENAERFWPWLFRIAGNKFNRHYKRERRFGNVQMSEPGDSGGQNDAQDEVANQISRELKQAVIEAMGQLKPEQRKVLVLRCYEGMKYSEIGEATGCSQIGAQMRFMRAKKKLAKHLARSGFGKGMLVMALTLFGKMTATTEAAAAKVVITTGTVKVGSVAAIAAAVTSKTAVVSVAAAGVIAVGMMVGSTEPKATIAETGDGMRSLQVSSAGQGSHSGEYWYYFPQGGDGPVMMRVIEGHCCSVRHNESGNYYFDKRKGGFTIENYRPWHKDLRVWQLPTDKPELRKFISEVEGVKAEAGFVSGEGAGLLVISKPDKENGEKRATISYQYNVLKEDFFQYNLPAGAEMIDNRDSMHKRGWTFFKVEGYLEGESVKGQGRMPFVYSRYGEFRPWLRLKVGKREIITSDFVGLGRPWMGLHTIDTVRRDAAGQKIWFETEWLDRGSKGRVKLISGQTEIIYTIDMKKDLVEKIEFTGEKQGQLVFEYLEEVEKVSSEFAEPRMKTGDFSILEFLGRY